ncbi:MAG: LamG-like jellyroll fold domain-containing protein [Planctomycetaceae bacterium]|nr:LamG domain-containing protein [Planctomycetaceae bacterium]
MTTIHRSALIGTVVCLLSAAAAPAAVTNYWSISPTSADTTNGLIDVVGGKNAVAVGGGPSSNPANFNPGATGDPNEAARIWGGTIQGGAYQTPIMSLGTSFTYEAVFQFTNWATNGWGYFAGRSDGPIELGFRNPGNGSGYWTFRDPVNGNVNFGNISTPLAANAWYHLAVTYDGATANLYLTRIQENLTAVSLLSTGTTAVSRNPTGTGRGLDIGCAQNATFNMGGWVDWAALHNRALTPDELLLNLQNNEPIPEPATMALLLLGGIGALLKRKRR